LLELAAAPPEVRVEPALIDLLSRVRRALDGAVAFVSGRSIADLDQLFAPVSWPAAGVHGLERRDASGHLNATSSVDAAVIGRARNRLEQASAGLPGTIVEDKGLAVALHYRQAPHFETPARRAARAIARESGGNLRLLEGQMVLELLPAGATKSDAIRAFLQERPFYGRRPIFIGDDVTDEQALVDVERMGGLSVAVGDRVGAMLRVAGPRDVRVFLEDLADSGVPAA
jgi:trehalose 6-phosphate phosphatase